MQAVFNTPELIILIFQSCNGVSDALSLASTCTLLASIWRVNTAAILFPVLRATIPGFDQALLAVR